ncbi:hypothetical protein C8E87_2152 [Paractinoplanes brasiliensis]|uniref:Fimbrial assembly protein PilN n=2 Tax=Paractinoplanes brasiliensis TaxID=52695 RepID=A0A4R6JTX8_9ACTN|nr:hypothetical protein C8E87_2152 [Actinoplanes brasiliensis]GID26730.1 hypothetical protein Abr02nite_17130 [Actinoplanes brasiliensis]
MTMTQTSLLPVDPAVSPAQANRILTIRANLLPEEITAGRSARRTRGGLIVAVVLVLAVLGGWYYYAVQQLDTANDNLDTASGQVLRAQQAKRGFAGVTGIINDRDALTADLKALMANDLPWATTTDKLRANAAAAGVTIEEISGTVLMDQAATTTTPADSASGTAASGAASAGAASAGTASAAARPVGNVTLAGTAPDKPQIALFIDKLADLDGFADPYLTNLSLNDGKYDYAISVKVTSAALCGRFTKPCPATGGN